VKVYVGGLEKSRMAAPEDVTTTRLTDGALFLTALRRPTVPLIAEEQSNKQLIFPGGFWGTEEYGTRTWIEDILLDVLNTEMEWAGCVDHSLERWIRNDGLVKGYSTVSLRGSFKC
jgi:hypothetical protein